MPNTWIILVVVFLLLLWNTLTVFFLTRAARKGKLSPQKFTIALVLGFSFIVSFILFFVLTVVDRVSLPGIGFVLLILFINVLISFPAVYFSSKFLLGRFFAKWTSQNKDQRTEKM
jgi:hypothetical protein